MTNSNSNWNSIRIRTVIKGVFECFFRVTIVDGFGLYWRFYSTGCGEIIFTLLLYILFRVVCMSLRCVIRRSNRNFVGFSRIILKIVENYPLKCNSHFTGKRQIWPTRDWNLTINFVAIWGQCALKCLI